MFDLSGTLIAEADASGAAQREYIHIDGLPVGFVDGTTLYFVHPDHLGAPQKITDAAKAVVWHGQFTPFGQQLSITGALTANWRFPGQYHDAEAALSYNYFRTYDPTLGRYLQSDPIGLAGGPNTYAYVGGNPLMRVDPRGLKTDFEWLTGLPDSCRVYAINLIAGWQDAMTFGLAAYYREVGRINSEVDESSTGYRYGEYAGTVTGIVAGGLGALKIARAGVLKISNALKAAKAAKGSRLGDEIGILRDAARGKWNFGLGSSTRAEAEKLGKAWVGDGYKVASDGKTLISRDGLRQYRPPSYKPSLDKVQANFEQRFPGQQSNSWQSNGHLDITD